MQALIQLLEKVTHPADSLVGSAQTQLLLVLDTSPKMKNCLERKVKCHDRQLGRASNLATLSGNEIASLGFWIRKLCNSEMTESALSSVGSLPF